MISSVIMFMVITDGYSYPEYSLNYFMEIKCKSYLEIRRAVAFIKFQKKKKISVASQTETNSPLLNCEFRDSGLLYSYVLLRDGRGFVQVEKESSTLFT